MHFNKQEVNNIKFQPKLTDIDNKFHLSIDGYNI